MPPTVTVSYVLAAGRPLLVVEVTSGAAGGALTAETDPVAWSFLDRGLKLLPGFFEVALPEETDLRLRIREGQLALTAPGDHVVTAAPLDNVPGDWLDACREEQAAIVLVGRGTGAGTAATPLEATRAVHEAAKAARVIGGVVPLAG